MSIARLSAGAGYRYLTRSTACADVDRPAGSELTAYYAASGNPPGRWYGSGLAALGRDAGGPGGHVACDADRDDGLRDDGSGYRTDDSAGYGDGPGAVDHTGDAGRLPLRPGDVVTEEAMARLFGEGRDPVTGAPLGRAYPVFAPLAERVARRVAALPGGMTPSARAEAVAVIEATAAARTPRQPVAGFDLTFSARKSVSVLWALGDDVTRQAVHDAHQRALRDVLTYAEATAVFTRTGKGGVAQVPTRGVIAAAFDHWDSRTGDPQLHTHVVIANKVQGLDGAWRSLDSRALHHAAVALSELYDNVLADHLAAALPVRWGFRGRGPRRGTGFELDGLDDDLLAAFSTRTADIDAAFRDLVTTFTATRGRRPTAVEVTRLRQRATLATRPAKTGRRLADLLHAWAGHARAATGRSPRHITAQVLEHDPAVRLRHDQVPALTVDRLAALVLDRVAQRDTTFTTWRIRAEVHRATRGLRMATTGDRVALTDRVTTAVARVAVPVSPVDPVPVVAGFTRPDGASVFTRAGMDTFTHPELLAAETRLLDAHLHDHDAPTVPTSTAQRIATAPSRLPVAGGPVSRLAGDQAAAVIAVATSGRRLDVLVGPAGTGKTTTLAALRLAWETRHGHGSVIGLAPSATAAHELGQALGVGCENTHKWLHETTGPGAATRAAARAGLVQARDARLRAGDPRGARRIDAQIRAVDAGDRSWRLRAGQLLILDEASLAGTRTLDALLTQAQAAGAKLLLVGDHQQLSAVDAGGAFPLLARHGHPARLVSLFRFRHRWEAQATRALRDGDPSVIGAYRGHDRLHDGPRDLLLEDAYAAWQADTDTGHASLLLAVDTDTVTALNERAHADRVATGAVTGPVVALGDDASGSRGHAGAGDRVLTRRNDRRISDGAGGHVRNGALWTVTAVHPDGALTVTPTRHDHPLQGDRHPDHPDLGACAEPGRAVVLPASYVAEHVDPGYATTVHRAQGVTLDTAYLLAGPGTSREALYVGMTRGRDANHLYLATDTREPDCHRLPDQPAVTDAELDRALAAILATSSADTSATQAILDAADAANALHRLTRIRDTLTAATEPGLAPAGSPSVDVAGDAALGVTGVPVSDAVAHVTRLVRERTRDLVHGRPQPAPGWLPAAAAAPVADTTATKPALPQMNPRSSPDAARSPRRHSTPDAVHDWSPQR